MQQSTIQLPFHDAYALRRAYSRMTIEGVYMSPSMRLFLDAFGDLTQDENYSRLNAAVAKNQGIIAQILPIDPTGQQDYLNEAIKFINANDLKNLSIPRYLLTDYPFYDFAMNALVGASGGGKSFVALDFAAKTALATDKGTIAYIAAEGLSGYAARWEAWKKHHGRDTDNLIFYPEPVNFMDDDMTGKFIQQAERENVKMLVVDTVARCMVGADENSTKDMGVFVSQIDRTKKALNCGVLMVHHTGKDGTMRGSSALYAACDSVVFLSRNEDAITIHNEHDKGGKNKYQKEAASRTFRLLPVEVRIKDAISPAAVLVESELIVDESTAGDELSSNKRMILEAVEVYEAGLPAAEIMKSTDIGRSSLYYNLRNLVKSEYLTREGDNYIITSEGKEALKASPK